MPRTQYHPSLMHDALKAFLGSKRLLLAIATAREATAIPGLSSLHPGPLREWTRLDLPAFDLVITGVGKANAAAAVARALDPGRHGLVVSLGIAGALPRSHGPLLIGAPVAADRCVYADEGLQSPDGFTGCATMGFPLGPFDDAGVPVPRAWLAILAPLGVTIGPIATVSTCSGTDALAAQTAARTGAIAEAMEGAAVAHVAARLGVATAELRAISNTTGDRAAQRWNIPAALESLRAVLGPLLG